MNNRSWIGRKTDAIAPEAKPPSPAPDTGQSYTDFTLGIASGMMIASGLWILVIASLFGVRLL